MLSEKSDIDQLFSRKLEHFEKTPPPSVWEGVEAQLKYHRRLLAGLKTVSIAATLVLVCLAGWWMNNSAGKLGSRSGHPGKQTVVYTDQNPVKNQTDNSIHLISDKNKSALVQPSNNRQVSTSKISLLAAFAANTSFIGGDGHVISQKTEDQFVMNKDGNLPVIFEQNLINLKKISSRMAALVSKDLPVNSPTDINSLSNNTIKEITADEAAEIAIVPPVQKGNGEWSLKTEFGSVLNNRTENFDQHSELNFMGSQNVNNKVTSENSYMVGILAGYKVSERITVKSGAAFKNIRQTELNNNQGLLKRHFKYIEIPVQIVCKLIDSKIGVGLTGGFSSGLLIGDHETLSLNNEPTSRGKSANMQKLTYSGSFGLELGYDITKHFTITVEPRIRHCLNSLSANNSVNYNQDHLEIATGLTYCFD